MSDHRFDFIITLILVILYILDFWNWYVFFRALFIFVLLGIYKYIYQELVNFETKKFNWQQDDDDFLDKNPQLYYDIDNYIGRTFLKLNISKQTLIIIRVILFNLPHLWIYKSFIWFLRQQFWIRVWINSNKDIFFWKVFKKDVSKWAPRNLDHYGLFLVLYTRIIKYPFRRLFLISWRFRERLFNLAWIQFFRVRLFGGLYSLLLTLNDISFFNALNYLGVYQYRYYILMFLIYLYVAVIWPYLYLNWSSFFGRRTWDRANKKYLYPELSNIKLSAWLRGNVTGMLIIIFDYYAQIKYPHYTMNKHITEFFYYKNMEGFKDFIEDENWLYLVRKVNFDRYYRRSERLMHIKNHRKNMIQEKKNGIESLFSDYIGRNFYDWYAIQHRYFWKFCKNYNLDYARILHVKYANPCLDFQWFKFMYEYALANGTEHEKISMKKFEIYFDIYKELTECMFFYNIWYIYLVDKQLLLTCHTYQDVFDSKNRINTQKDALYFDFFYDRELMRRNFYTEKKLERGLLKLSTFDPSMFDNISGFKSNTDLKYLNSETLSFFTTYAKKLTHLRDYIINTFSGWVIYRRPFGFAKEDGLDKEEMTIDDNNVQQDVEDELEQYFNRISAYCYHYTEPKCTEAITNYIKECDYNEQYKDFSKAFYALNKKHIEQRNEFIQTALRQMPISIKAQIAHEHEMIKEFYAWVNAGNEPFEFVEAKVKIFKAKYYNEDDDLYQVEMSKQHYIKHIFNDKTKK